MLAKCSAEAWPVRSSSNIRDLINKHKITSPQSRMSMQETWVRSLGGEDPLEEGLATHSSILAWRIPTDRGA